MSIPCRSSARVFVCALLVVLLFALPAVTATGVYMKLLPGKELCVGHYVVRDPEEDPVKVSFTHRTLTPRLTSLKLFLYAPSSDPNVRGKRIEVADERADTLGDLSSLYFDAEETGVYTLCIKSRRNYPVINMEMYFSSSNEVIQPPTVADEAAAIDKPIELADYEPRLKMLQLTVETTRDEIRMAQTRRFMFDHTSKSILIVTVGFSLFNMLLAVLLSWWSERSMERFFIKAKTA